MKLLVASVGNSLDSLVAKQFEHAAWYLVVDAETLSVDPIKNLTPNDDHNAIKKAVGEHVQAVIAGKFSPRTFKRLSDAKQMLAFAHGITVRQLIGKIRSEEIVPQELGREAELVKPIGTLPRLAPTKSRAKSFVGAGFASDSQRGQHHLQQYGGRGH